MSIHRLKLSAHNDVVMFAYWITFEDALHTRENPVDMLMWKHADGVLHISLQYMTLNEFTSVTKGWANGAELLEGLSLGKLIELLHQSLEDEL